MDNLMDNPWFLRFTALFLAMLLFFSVKSDNDNTGENSSSDQLDVIQNVPVEVYYDSANSVVTGVPESVDVTIEGPTNFVQTTKILRDFRLFVDLRELTMGEHRVHIQYENFSDKLQVRLDPAVINVVIEEKITKTLRVDPEFNERLLAEDFEVTDITVTPRTIEVTGAESIVNSISFVKASATGEQGINKSFEQQARVRVLDRELNKLNVVIVPETVNVKVEVTEYNKEVPIVLKTRGTPAAGVTIDSVNTNEKMVKLFGPRRVLDNIKEYVVDVDVSGVTGNRTIDVDLNKPKGVSSLSVDRVKVTIETSKVDDTDDTAKIETPAPVTTETVNFDDVAVDVRGLDPKFKGTFLSPSDGKVSLTVNGDKSIISKLDQDDFKVYVDASQNTEEGEASLPIKVEGPETVRWTLSNNEATIRIELA